MSTCLMLEASLLAPALNSQNGTLVKLEKRVRTHLDDNVRTFQEQTGVRVLNASLQKTAVRQASVWVRWIRRWLPELMQLRAVHA